MHKLKITLVVLLSMFVIFSVGCIESSTDLGDEMIDIESVDEYDLVTANNAFAFEMYSATRHESEDNLLFSPYSIFSAVAICYEGAEESTKEQIASVFGYPLDKVVLEANSQKLFDTTANKTDSLKIANGLWVQEDYPLNEQYVSNVGTYHNGSVKQLDFISNPEPSRHIINEWVKGKTNGKISEIVPSGAINLETRMVVTSTIYFNGTWFYPFDTRETKQGQFYHSNGQSKLVDFMSASETFNYAENHAAKIVELPYQDNNISMYIVLPRENNISEFENSFTIDEYVELKSNMSKQPGVIFFPKFSYSKKSELSPLLQKMGMIDAFNLATADFSGIYDTEKQQNENLAISQINHKAFIDVNERGTEAAAATSVAFFTGYSHPNWEFRADHPFIFLIEDKDTGCILFMGKIENPEYETN